MLIHFIHTFKLMRIRCIELCIICLLSTEEAKIIYTLSVSRAIIYVVEDILSGTGIRTVCLLNPYRTNVENRVSS